MNFAHKTNSNVEKRPEIRELLSSYWGNDIWYIRETFFNDLRPAKWSVYSNKTIDFAAFSHSIRDEVKYMYAYQLKEREIKLTTVIQHRVALKQLAEYLNKYYPEIDSIVNIPYDKAIIKWRSFLIDNGRIINDGRTSSQYEAVFNHLYYFYINLYNDTVDEYEKDVWDCRKIPGAKLTENEARYYLNFTDVPLEFRGIVKRFIKFRTIRNSQAQCRHDIMALRLFTKHIHIQEPSWEDLRMLTRKHMEDYLSWYRGYSKCWKWSNPGYIISLRIFLEYIQCAQYLEAPEAPVVLLIFKEDIPKVPQRTENDIKYIPEGVLQQLEEKLEFLKPSIFIPIVILLRATGWRISDILNLRYDTCLERTPQGWYLCGDITKTQVLNHRVPITDEVYAVIQAVIDEVKAKSIDDNNPNHLLFVRFNGRRKGRCPKADSIRYSLNYLAKTQNIIDDKGNIFHFKNHAFRHTKAIELINNGMNLLHVQKWMAHASPEMTLWYAKILDTTMRKSWEEATKQGLFRINERGKPIRIDISDIENEDIIEWEYIRHNLDAVRMPLGYCMKPKKQECHTQLNPCLTCRNLCTTPDFIPQYELEIQETKAVIERGKAQNRNIWVEKNQALLERYESILIILKGGKTHHKAGKKGREYIGEERNNG